MNAALLKKINRTCEANVGYGIVPEQEVVFTDIPQLDEAIGGIPKGRIIEIYGGEDSGKTALALYLTEHLPGPVLYADADHGLSPYILNGRDMYLLDIATLEDTLEACRTAAIGGFGTIVIDTVTALPTRVDVQVSINDKYVAPNMQAKVLSQCLPILNNLMRVTGCTLILVSQMRNKHGVVYGNPAHPTSGRAVGYYAALRLETNRVGILKSGCDVFGQNMLFSVQKNKYATPGRRAEIKLIYGEGLFA